MVQNETKEIMSRGKAITAITLRQILYLELLGDTCAMIALKLGFHPDTIRKVKTRASYKELKGHVATKVLRACLNKREQSHF